jgi:HlyD family secretion protein
MNTNRAALIGTASVLALGLGGWALSRRGAADEVTYRSAVVQRTDLRETVSASGIVQPLTTVDIKSRAGGEVKVLSVEVGDFVKPGQLIARIDPTDSQTAYNQAQADVLAAQARISQAQQTLTLESRTRSVSVADAEAAVRAAEARVASAEAQAKAQPTLTDAAVRQARANLTSAEQALAQLRKGTDPTARADARTSLTSAQANLANAELNLQRQQKLLDRGFVSQQAVDAARTERDVAAAQVEAARTRAETVGQSQGAAIAAAEARVAEARAALRSAEAQRVQVNLRRQDVASARAQLAQARAGLETARANQGQVGIRANDIQTAQSQMARAKASLLNATVQLDSTTVRAPRAGVVLQKYVEQGTIITSGQSLTAQGASIVQLGDVSRLFVDAAVDEADLASVKVGQKVKVVFDAFPDQEWEGRVRRIDPRGVTDNNVTSIKTQVEILKPDRRLRPGLNAECEFLIAEKTGVLAVPTRAVRNDKGKKYVEVFTPDPSAAPAGKKPEPGSGPGGGGGGRGPGGPGGGPGGFGGGGGAPAGEKGKAERREVVTGMEAGDQVEIVSGLKEGDKVVTQTIRPEDQKGGGGQGGPGGAGGRGQGGPGGFGGGRSRPGSF